MRPSTVKLHKTLIRLLKGCLTAWEYWLREEQAADAPSSSTTSDSGGQ